MNRNLNRRIHPIAEADGLSPKNIVTRIEIIVTDEGTKMFFNGNKETKPIAYPELSKVGIILLEFCQQIQKILANKEKSRDALHEIECNI